LAQEGKRLVIDIRNATSAVVDAAITESRGVVGGVMTQEFRTDGTTTTRVLVQLVENATYRITPSKEGLRVLFARAEKTAPASARDERLPIAEPTSLVQLRDVRFDRGTSQDRVVLELGGTPTYATHARSATRSVLELDGVAVPTSLVRTLDVGAFGGLVHAVSTYRKDGKVVIDVDHEPMVAGVVVKNGGSLHYVFAKGRPDATLTGVAEDGGAARRTKTLAAEAGGSLVPFGDALAGASEGAPAAGRDSQAGREWPAGREWQSEPDQAGAFPGTPLQLEDRRNRPATRRVDLDLKDADIHNVFRILADVGNVNIVAADNVSGAVTIRMKNVPWDEALETILRAKKLGMERRGNIVRIALAADLAAERELKIKELRSRLQLEPLEVRLIPVSYATANDMATRAKEMVSPRGSLTVDPRTNVIIAQDVAGNLNRIEELVRALDTQTPQVLIEARIVEATSSFKRDVGIQWGGDVAFSPGTGNETGTAFPSSIGLVGGASDPNTPTAGLSPRVSTVANPNFAVNLPATVGAGAGGALGLTLGSIDNTVNLAVRLSAAESTGMLRVVSSPRILALDNNEARIVQGTLIPFSQVSAQGVQTVFQEARLQLLVKPHVTADGSIAMHVRVNRDEPDFNQTSARGDPTILRREAETDLIVRDGHTAVIGGIYTRNTGRNVDQLPVLGDIPVIGVLFQRRRASDTRSELVIFLTPRIVNRAEALGR
ncbi:MAG: type IV pilus secretin PilQ, partial [Deltaproteobacteria bacterium]|nr:type IV pilus secretin PilQ [Deltaproteobacteria bacterium]